MLVENIYESLKTLEPDLSMSRFCTEYLDTCRSYLHNRKYENRDVSSDVLIALYGNLKQSAKTYSLLLKDTDRPESWSAHFERRAELFDSLADSVLEDITSRSLH